MGLFNLFGNKTKKIKDFTIRNAVILDVRSKSEYDSGAIPGAKHMALEHVDTQISEIKKWNKPIITCCKSGMRSARAAGVLKRNGMEAINGGGWRSLNKKLNSTS